MLGRASQGYEKYNSAGSFLYSKFSLLTRRLPQVFIGSMPHFEFFRETKVGIDLTNFKGRAADVITKAIIFQLARDYNNNNRCNL